MDFYIREAEISDAAAICDIYGFYAKNTFVTFTEINGSVLDYENSILETKKDYPYIVACDLNDRVIGMAYGGRIRHHDAYKYSVETTIYLADDVPKQSGVRNWNPDWHLWDINSCMVLLQMTMNLVLNFIKLLALKKWDTLQI